MQKKINKYSAPLSIALLILGAVWVFASKDPSGTTSAGNISAPQKGFLAPDFSLQDQENNSVTLSDLRGKPVVINFWASWCKPCQMEMPALERVYQKFKSQGLFILGVNATNQDDSVIALNLASGLRLSFPILFDIDGIVSQQYRVRALPTTYFIDTNGIIQDIIIGGPMPEALLHSRVQMLLETDGK